MSAKNFPYKAKERVVSLITTLEPIVNRDPEQEIQGIAVPVFESLLDELKDTLEDDPVVGSVVTVYENEFFGNGEPVRAVDALLVARHIDAAIGAYPIRIA